MHSGGRACPGRAPARRVDDLEVRVEQAEVQREHLRVVRARLERAPVGAQRLDLHRERQPSLHVRRRRVHDHPRPVAPGRLADLAEHALGEHVVGGDVPRCERRTVRGPQPHPVDAEGAPVVPVHVPRDEVPAAPAVDQSVRLHRSPRRQPRRRVVVEAQLLMVPAGGDDRSEHVRIHLALVRRQGQRVGPQGVDAVPQARGEHLLQLRQRPDRGLLDAGDRAARGGPQADRDGHGLLVVEEQGRHRPLGAEPVAAGHPRRASTGYPSPRSRSTSWRTVRVVTPSRSDSSAPVRRRRDCSSVRSRKSRAAVSRIRRSCPTIEERSFPQLFLVSTGDNRTPRGGT